MNRWSLGMVIILILSWLVYYPPFFTFADEGQYLHTTWLFSEGKSPKIINPLESFSFVSRNNQTFTPQYAPGHSMLLLPFTFFGWKTIFLSGLLLHLGVFCLFMRLLRQNNLNPNFALLYLLFPGFVFFSRTIMGELASIALIFLGFYFYNQENKGYWSGFFFGLSLFVRYTNVVFAIPFFIAALIKDRQKFIKILLGFLPFVLAIAFYNYQIYGSVFSTGIKQPREFSFWLMGKYILSLLIVYPLLIISPPFSKDKNKWEIISCFVLALIGFSYSGIDTFHYDLFKNLVIGYRYLFPAITLLLFTYCGWLNQFLNRKKVHRMFLIICLLLLVGDIYIMQRQYSFTEDNLNIMNTIYANIPRGSLIFGDSYVTSIFLNKFFGDIDAFTIYTYPTSECINKEKCIEKIELSLNKAKELSRKKQSYFVFAESSIISNEIKPLGSSIGEVSTQRKAEFLIAKRFDSTLIYEQKQPNYIQIWKLP